MESIEIIRDKSELEGTCYIELSLGKYQGNHWKETSLFFEEETFGFIEAIFERNVPGYDHYSMNDADSKAWSSVITELKELIDILISAKFFSDIVGKVCFVFSGTRDYFENNFELCRDQLQKMLIQLIEWVESHLKKYVYIAILGI